jgi:hypothetical protein
LAIAISLICVSSLIAETTALDVSVGTYIKERDNGGISFTLNEFFIFGVAEGFSWATINSEANEGKRLFCPPEHMAVSQNDYLYIFNRYRDENKSWIADDTPIQPIIIKSIIAAFPCNR